MRMFVKLSSQFTQPVDRIYMWSPILEPNYYHMEEIHRWKQLGEGEGPEFWETLPVIEIEHSEEKYRNLILNYIKKDIVMIGIKDHLTTGNFNPWLDENPAVIASLVTLFESYNNKKFILFTSMEKLEEYIKCDNVDIVPWGGDITNQISEYKSLNPVIEKDFNSPYTFVSLNRGFRHPRAILLSLLFGLNVDKCGLISCMFKNDIMDLNKEIKWPFTNKQKEILNRGFQKFKKTDLLINDDKEIYQKHNNDNSSNFQNKLSHYYRRTFVEIVNETSYTEKAFNLTEKTLNSIYACNFPIILSSKGTISFLRDMGLDMFDDIIDHRYDSINSPIDRMFSAITDNLELLTNNEKTKRLWKENKHRFLKNVDFVKTDLYDFYQKRAEDKFFEILKGL
jgi:hypothetical protein